MKKRLTVRFVQTVAPPTAGRSVYIDTAAAGLELRVSALGHKAWSIRYRLKDRARRRTTYGAYPAIPLQEARARAKEIAAAAARGIDLPEHEERQREEEEKSAKRPRTVGHLLDQYVEDYCKTNQRRWSPVARMFEMHVKPAIGKKPLIELRRADLVELLDDLQNKKGLRAQVNRVRAQLFAALNWAVEREFLNASPATAIKKRVTEAARERTLTDSELRAIWHAADRLPDPGRALVKVLVLTGQRRDEVRCLPWNEVDLERAVWLLPAWRNKSKRDHEIPLPPAVLALFGDRPQPGKPVFTINGKVPYSGQKRLKALLDQESGVTGWRYHDLRRTVASGMAALHVPQDTIDRVLNHAKGKLASVYNRHQYFEQKRQALEVWSERVAIIVGDGRDADNVVELHSTSV